MERKFNLRKSRGKMEISDEKHPHRAIVGPVLFSIITDDTVGSTAPTESLQKTKS